MKYVLSLRGGGIRGLSTAILLDELERQIGKPCAETFDLIAGTSVGGIIATGLALKIPAIQLIDFFIHEGPEIFKERPFAKFLLMLGHPRYDIKNLRAALTRHFDAGATKAHLADVYTKLMVTSMRYRGLEARLWKSWKHPDMFAVDVAASSAAAPTYFLPVDIADYAHADGGMCANNPAAIAAVECKKLWPTHDVVIVDIACPDDKSQFEPRSGGIFNIAPHLANTFIGAGEDLSSYIAKRLVGACGSVLSIAPPLLDASRNIGDASASNLRALRLCAEYRLERNTEDILRVLGRA